MSTPVAHRTRATVAAVLERIPAPGPRPLADPPPGSDLAPVMGEPGLPFVGQTLPMFVDGLRFNRSAYARYGSVYWTSVIGTPVVVVLGGEAISTVFANRDGAFSSAEGWDYFIGPFFNRGVMLMDAPEHRQHRLIMQQAFTRPRLRGYLEAMHPAIGRGISGWPTDGELHVYTALKQLTLDIATEVFMGGTLGAEADGLNRAFVDAVVAGQALIRADVPIPGAKWHRGIASRRRAGGALPRTGPRPSGGGRRRPVQRAVPRRVRGGRALQRRGHRQPHDLRADGRPRYEHDHVGDDDL
jgi:cytochrome P450